MAWGVVKGHVARRWRRNSTWSELLNDALSAVLEESFMNWVRHAAKDKEDNDDDSNEGKDALSRGR